MHLFHHYVLFAKPRSFSLLSSCLRRCQQHRAIGPTNPMISPSIRPKCLWSYFSWFSLRCSATSHFGNSRYLTPFSDQDSFRPIHNVPFQNISLGSYALCPMPIRHMSATPPSGQSKEKTQSTDDTSGTEQLEEMEKLGLFKRYKKMLKEYWYVLLPVHMVTSLIWFGSFYYMAQSGFDIVPLLTKIGVSENYIQSLQSSGLGYLAVATAMYKLATPARYFVTLGCTTFAIKYLTRRGMLKPMPSRAELKDILQKKAKQLVK